MRATQSSSSWCLCAFALVRLCACAVCLRRAAVPRSAHACVRHSGGSLYEREQKHMQQMEAKIEQLGGEVGRERALRAKEVAAAEEEVRKGKTEVERMKSHKFQAEKVGKVVKADIKPDKVSRGARAGERRCGRRAAGRYSPLMPSPPRQAIAELQAKVEELMAEKRKLERMLKRAVQRGGYVREQALP